MIYVMCVYVHDIRHVCICTCYMSCVSMHMLYIMCVDAHAIHHVSIYT